MKSKLTWILTPLLALMMSFSFAQEKTITGTVTDESGLPLPGVSVLVVGTTKGSQTNFDGNYSIVASEGQQLRFSYVGQKTAEKLVGSSPVVNVQLLEDAQALEEVVVTALGITKKERGLGVSVGTLGSDEIVKSRSTSAVNALAGKVSGVKITQQSGTPGGSSTILVRGATSLSGDNQPIFVIDGMPISNQSINADGISGGVDSGNRAGDINPDDIESISVLKGASASALYGARAKNGAIVITTKKGNRNTGLKVSVNSSIRFDTPLKLPEYQNEYAQGTAGVYDEDSLNGWGPRISDVQDQLFTDFKGDQVTLVAKPNNVEDFFRTGLTRINTIALSGGNQQSDFRTSYTNTDVTGIVPGSDYRKNNLALNVGRNFTDRFMVRTNVSFISSRSSGRTQQGSNDSNVIIDNIVGIPRTVSFEDLENNYIDVDGSQIGLTQRSNNPYWVIDKNSFSVNVERLIASTQFDYKITSNLTLTDRVGTDFYNESRQKKYAKGTIGVLNGSFTNWDYFNQIINNDVYLNYNKINYDGFSLSAVAGHNLYKENYSRTTNTADNLTVDGLYSLANGQALTASDYKQKKELHGVYADFNLDYKNTYFLNVTGRNDWSSTLPVDNNSYFYPSVNGAIVFSEFIPKNDIINFGKIRGGYAEVGSDANPYSLDFGFSPATNYFVQYNLSNNVPQGGIIGFQAPRVLPNANLKPQRKKEYELGLDLRFIKNIFDFKFTYYNSDTEDQILNVDVPLTTGFFEKSLNAGVVNNKGYEIDLNVSPFKKGNFKWDLGFNFNKNEQVVESLVEGLDEFQLQSGFSGLTIKASPGQQFGLYGTAFLRNENGDFVINSDTGLKEVVPNQRLGNTAPDWTMGINNSFSFKNFNLSFLLDIKQGGTLFSGTSASLRSAGLAIETLENRGEVFVDGGVNEVVAADGTISYVENSTPVQNMEEYWGNQSSTSNTEGNIFDASYVKLREVSLSYSLPREIVKKLFFDSVKFGLEGRNLWIISDNVPHIDPEVNFFGPGGANATVEFASVPSSRSVGLNVQLSF